MAPADGHGPIVAAVDGPGPIVAAADGPGPLVTGPVAGGPNLAGGDHLRQPRRVRGDQFRQSAPSRVALTGNRRGCCLSSLLKVRSFFCIVRNRR